MKKNELLNRIKEAVREVDKTAEIHLYGSRARTDFKKDSDWDFLILINLPLTDSIRQEIRHKLYRIEWETDTIISSIIYNKKDWQRPLVKASPFYQEISRESIQI
jgi:predicted nucleotidyltransferase